MATARGTVTGGSRPADHGRPPNPNYRPPTVAPRDGNDREALWPMFRSVDKDGEAALGGFGRRCADGGYRERPAVGAGAEDRVGEWGLLGV